MLRHIGLFALYGTSGVVLMAILAFVLILASRPELESGRPR